MTDDPIQESPSESQASASRDPARVAEQLAAFENRVRAGEFDHGGFHRAVQDELFPLLGDGALPPDAFSHLVAVWAKRNHPFDWSLKPFGRLT